MSELEQLREKAWQATEAANQAALDMHPDNPESVKRTRALLEEARAALSAYDEAIRKL